MIASPSPHLLKKAKEVARGMLKDNDIMTPRQVEASFMITADPKKGHVMEMLTVEDTNFYIYLIPQGAELA